MKYFISMLAMSLVMANAYAAPARPAMSNKIMSAPSRYTASINQLNTMSNVTTNAAVVDKTDANSTGQEPVSIAVVEEPIDMREAERAACLNNNVGIGNTFVWASRYSDTSNYAGMVEDVKNPQNNVCFVRVELKSNDESRISVSDIAPKYFMWGEDIECGGWADKNVLEKRILDAKKGNRVAGIVASTIGGAGVGVGIMESFGNQLIGHGLSGQKAMDDNAFRKSQLLTLKEKGRDDEYNEYIGYLKTIKTVCETNKDIDQVCTVYEHLYTDKSLMGE